MEPALLFGQSVTILHKQQANALPHHRKQGSHVVTQTQKGRTREIELMYKIYDGPNIVRSLGTKQDPVCMNKLMHGAMFLSVDTGMLVRQGVITAEVQKHKRFTRAKNKCTFASSQNGF